MNDAERILRRLIADRLAQSEWEWRAEYDWTVSIVDAKGKEIFHDVGGYAQDILDLARSVHSEMKQGYEDMMGAIPNGG